MAKPESDDGEKEINCNIASTNLDNYILACGLNNNIKYELNNSISIVDSDILLVNFDDGNSKVRNIIVKENNNHRKFYYNKSSGLSTGALVAIILVPIFTLGALVATFFFFKRKNIESPASDNSTQTNINIQTKI